MQVRPKMGIAHGETFELFGKITSETFTWSEPGMLHALAASARNPGSAVQHASVIYLRQFLAR
jgi:hypothetical protein